jgi:hypothetical protein
MEPKAFSLLLFWGENFKLGDKTPKEKKSSEFGKRFS